jgi:hypothetical protein
LSEAACNDRESGKYPTTVVENDKPNSVSCVEDNYSITTGARDAATCDNFVAGKFAPARGGALKASCESCGSGKYSAALQGRRAAKGS